MVTNFLNKNDLGLNRIVQQTALATQIRFHSLRDSGSASPFTFLNISKAALIAKPRTGRKPLLTFERDLGNNNDLDHTINHYTADDESTNLTFFMDYSSDYTHYFSINLDQNYDVFNRTNFQRVAKLSYLNDFVMTRTEKGESEDLEYTRKVEIISDHLSDVTPVFPSSDHQPHFLDLLKLKKDPSVYAATTIRLPHDNLVVNIIRYEPNPALTPLSARQGSVNSKICGVAIEVSFFPVPSPRLTNVNLRCINFFLGKDLKETLNEMDIE